MSAMVQHAPRFNEEDAVRIAHDVYGLDASANPLPSERDQNFHLKASNGRAYVLKLANAAETLEVLKFQNEAMMHIADKGGMFPQKISGVPEVCKTLKGEQITSVDGVVGATHFVRLLTYLPGKPFALVKPHNADLLSSLGRFCGRMDRLLQDFDHPAAHRDFHWDLKNAARIVERYQSGIKVAERRTLVERFLQRFQAESAPQLPALRTSVIHNDANDYNVLVEPDGKWNPKVIGVIDFGDMVHTYTVSELAVACAYAMLAKADPLAAARHVVAGYHQALALTAQELAVLFDLICMRLCMSVCHSANQYRLQPDNDYLRISEEPAWRLLQNLANVHPRFARYAFRQTCGFPPVPQHEKITAWLQQHQEMFGPIVDRDLRGENQLVFDLSVGSLLLGGNGDGKSPAVVTEQLFRRMREANVNVGIGRYNEARLFYTNEHFKMPSDEMPQCRTIHLGIDLYLQSGSTVYAPLAGTVHSFENNSAHLDYGPTIILKHETDEGHIFYTLFGHLSPDSLDGLDVGDPIEKGKPIGRIGETDTNGGWSPHLHFQIILDMLGESGNFPGVAGPGERDIWTGICPDPNIILGIPKNVFPPRDGVMGKF